MRFDPNRVGHAKQDRKHELRHTKPFHCTVKDCQRKEGYSTANDLERHVKSKHADLYPPSKTYSCLVDKCKSKDKAWPRLDNFRSHLKRIHKLSDDQLDHYVRRSVAFQSDEGRLTDINKETMMNTSPG